MASVACDWDDHLDVSSILREDFLKSIAQVEEIFTLRDLAFQNFWLHVKIRECGAHSFLRLCLRLQTQRSEMFLSESITRGWFLEIIVGP